MSIVYVQFEVAIHRLSFQSMEEVEAYRLRIKELLSEYHPSGYSNILEDDVEVEITETAREQEK